MKCLPTLTAALLAAIPLCSQDPPVGPRPEPKPKAEIQDPRQAAVDKKLDDFLERLNRVDLSDEMQLRQVLDLAKKERPLWRGTRIEAAVQTQLGKFDATLRGVARRRMLLARLDGIDAKLAGSPGIDVLGQQFAAARDADVVDLAAAEGGELKARYDTTLRNLTRRYVDSLRAAATAAASAKTGEALAPFGTLEDVLRTVRDDALIANDLEAQAVYSPMCKQVCGEINGIVNRMFDEAYCNKVPWTDLLAAPTGWTGVPASSFTYEFGSNLTLTNAAGGSTGGLYFPNGDAWRDYVIDMEFKVASGSFSIYTRIGDKMDSKECPAFAAGTMRNPNVVLEYGKVHSMQVSTIGNQLVVVLDGASVLRDDIMGSKSRKGEFGIAVQVGTSMTITRLKVRLLR